MSVLRSVREPVIVFGTFSADRTQFRRCVLYRKRNRRAGSGLLSYPAPCTCLARAICRRDYFITGPYRGGTPRTAAGGGAGGSWRGRAGQEKSRITETGEEKRREGERRRVRDIWTVANANQPGYYQARATILLYGITI